MPDKAKIKIVFLGSQMERAGAQQMLLAQAGWFAKRGYETKAIFFYDKQGLHGEWQSSHAFPVLSLDGWIFGKSLFANGFRLVRALLSLLWQLRGNDVIVTYTPTSNLLGLPLAWLAGVRARTGTHHGHIEGTNSTMDRLHGKLTNSFLCSKMVAVSKQVREYALINEGASSSKVLVIENGVEPHVIVLSPDQKSRLRAELGVPDNGKLLITVGRLAIQKGHSVLLKAIARLQKNKQWKFVFAGTGLLRDELENEASELGIADQLVFVGLRKDVPELLAVSDVFIQPSLWEGLSLALLEAMFAGLPIVSTRVEGTIDVLEDGVNALLVPVGKDKELAQAIERILMDDALARKLAASSRQRAEEHYSLDRMCSSYQQLMADLIK